MSYNSMIGHSRSPYDMMCPPISHYSGPSYNSNMSIALFHIPSDATNSLYVDGVPNDSSQREVSHIFRPFPGFQCIRLIRKSTSTGREYFLCFVDFENVLQSTIALNTLQDYRFDRHDKTGLKISFAKESNINEALISNSLSRHIICVFLLFLIESGRFSTTIIKVQRWKLLHLIMDIIELFRAKKPYHPLVEKNISQTYQNLSESRKQMLTYSMIGAGLWIWTGRKIRSKTELFTKTLLTLGAIMSINQLKNWNYLFGKMYLAQRDKTYFTS